jgi:hypothetical protein
MIETSAERSNHADGAGSCGSGRIQCQLKVGRVFVDRELADFDTLFSRLGDQVWWRRVEISNQNIWPHANGAAMGQPPVGGDDKIGTFELDSHRSFMTRWEFAVGDDNDVHQSYLRDSPSW